MSQTALASVLTMHEVSNPDSSAFPRPPDDERRQRLDKECLLWPTGGLVASQVRVGVLHERSGTGICLLLPYLHKPGTLLTVFVPSDPPETPAHLRVAFVSPHPRGWYHDCELLHSLGEA